MRQFKAMMLPATCTSVLEVCSFTLLLSGLASSVFDQGFYFMWQLSHSYDAYAFFHKTLFADVSVQLFTLVRLLVRLLVSCVQIIINPKQSYSARKNQKCSITTQLMLKFKACLHILIKFQNRISTQGRCSGNKLSWCISSPTIFISPIKPNG